MGVPGIGKERMGEERNPPAQGCGTEAGRAPLRPVEESAVGTKGGTQREGPSTKYRDCRCQIRRQRREGNSGAEMVDVLIGFNKFVGISLSSSVYSLHFLLLSCLFYSILCLFTFSYFNSSL